jgi:O-antigen/teichoic acid export membrane protein
VTFSIAPPAALTRVKNLLPEGTLPVGLGLAISGICLYGFIAVASRALGLALYAPFATFWPVLFICGPGFFLPLEQEVGRALAARRARGLGSGPLVRRAAVTGFGVAGALAFGALAFFPVFGLTDRLFDGNALLLYALAAGFTAYCAEHLARGTLSGNGRFRAYGVLLGVEGIVRVSLCVALWLAIVKDPGYYGVAMVVGSAVAILVALRGQHGLIDPGPDAPWSELSSALGYLLVTSVLTQLRLNVAPIAIKLLATPAEAARTGPFLNSLIIARVPLFFFQAVQAALLPKLAGYASTGRHADLRRALRRLLALCLRRRCSSHGGHLRAPALGGPVPLLVRALIWVTPTWAPWPWPAPATWWRSS